jgi:hypothetical protein
MTTDLVILVLILVALFTGFYVMSELTDKLAYRKYDNSLNHDTNVMDRKTCRSLWLAALLFESGLIICLTWTWVQPSYR